MERFRHIQREIAIVILLSLGSTQVYAQDHSKLFQLKPLPARLLPQYVPCTYKESRYACFDAAAMIELNTLELQARFWHKQWEDSVELLAIKDEELFTAQEQLMVQDSLSHQDQDQITVLNNQIMEEIEAKNKWREKAENPPTWPLWVGGTVAVLGLGAFLGSLRR